MLITASLCYAIGAMRLGDAALLGGRRDTALMMAERGLMLSRDRGQRAFEGWALRLLAELAAGDGPPGVARAEQHWRAAMLIGMERDLRPLVAQCHVGLDKLYQRTGKRDQGQEHTTMYRELGMTYWLEKAETEMRDLG